MGHTKLRTFKGLQNGKESLREILDDLYWAYEQDHKHNEPEGTPENTEHQAKTKRILFQQHFDDDAYEWYADMGTEDKETWNVLREKFSCQVCNRRQGLLVPQV